MLLLCQRHPDLGQCALLSIDAARLALLGPDEQTQLQTLSTALGAFMAPPSPSLEHADAAAASHHARTASLAEVANRRTFLCALEHLIDILVRYSPQHHQYHDTAHS